MTTRDARAITWLRDCQWTGWLHDRATKQVHTSNGDVWETPHKLRKFLESLPRWPQKVAGDRPIPAAPPCARGPFDTRCACRRGLVHRCSTIRLSPKSSVLSPTAEVSQ